MIEFSIYCFDLLYQKYKILTPWQSLNEDNRTGKQIRKYKFWHMLPQGLVARVASILYNYVRPKLWRKNK